MNTKSLPEDCVNMPITYTELHKIIQMKDIIEFLKDYDVETTGGIKFLRTLTYKKLIDFVNTICPFGTYFGADEFGVVGIWEFPYYVEEDYFSEITDRI